MKGLGSAMLMLGAFLLGARLCRERRKHEALLKDLIQALSFIKGELELRASPISELLECPGAAEGEAGAFFASLRAALPQLGERSFAELWFQELRRCLPELAGEEREALEGLGQILGRMDLDTEVQALSTCVACLARRLEEERRNAPNYDRVSLGLCLCSGLLLAIVLF